MFEREFGKFLAWAEVVTKKFYPSITPGISQSHNLDGTTKAYFHHLNNFLILIRDYLLTVSYVVRIGK